MDLSYSGPHFAADLTSTERGAQSSADSLVDYATTGLADSVVSGGVGMFNSVIGLGRAVGVTDSANVDVRDAIGNVLGNDNATFYDRHKTGVDAAGFAIASVATWYAGGAALKAAQAAGILGETLQLGTGLKNADAILGSPAVQSAAANAIQGVEKLSLFSKSMSNAYAMGLASAVLENVAGAVATDILNNQSVYLNPEGTSSGKKIMSLLGDEATSPMFWGFTAVTGLANVLKIKGFVTQQFDAHADKMFKEVTGFDLASVEGKTAGDALVSLRQATLGYAERPEMVAAMQDSTKRGWAMKGASIVEGVQDRAILQLTANVTNDEARAALNSYYKKLVNAPKEVDVASIVAGNTSADVLGLGDLADAISNKFQPSKMFGVQQAGNEFYHGSSSPIAELQEYTYNPLNYYGQGLYTTNAIGVAKGYTKKGLQSVEGQSLYKVTANPDAKFYNMEQPVAQDFKEHLSQISDIELTNEKTMHQIYDTIRNEHHGNADEVQAIFDTIAYKLQQEGYAGLQHTGGGLTGTPAHTVQIHFNPVATAKLELIPRTVFDDMAYANSLRKANGLQELSKSEFQASRALRDLGAAGPELRSVMNDMLQEDPTVAKELWTLSTKAFPERYVAAGKALGNSKIGSDFEEFLKVQGGEGSKLLGLHELLADSVSALANPATAEKFASYAPSLVSAMNKIPGLRKPWSDTSMFVNTRTGERMSHIIPAANDIGKVSMDKNSGAIILDAYKGGRRVYTYDASIFDPSSTKFLGKADELLQADHMQASAMWAAMAKQDLFGKVADGYALNIVEHDLPRLERAVQQMGENPELRITYGKSVVLDANAAEDVLKSVKQQLATKINFSREFSQDEVAHFLNIDNATARGEAQDFRLYGRKNYDQPEWIKVNSNPVNVKQEGLLAKSEAAVGIADTVNKQRLQNAAAQLHGEYANILPDAPFEGKAFVNPGAKTASMISGERPDFGSFSQAASAIGKLTADMIRSGREAVTESFAQFGKFNSPNFIVQRAELAAVDNKLRRDFHYLITSAEGEKVFAPKEMVLTALKGEKDYNLDSLDPELLNRIRGMDPEGHSVFSASKSVTEFFEHHVKLNAVNTDKHAIVSDALGRLRTYDPRAVYTPPMNLKQTPFVAFAVPTEAFEGADPRKFMVYGSTAAELEEKINSIVGSTEGKYKIVTAGKGGDIEMYKKMVGQYDRGEVMDELFFDAAKFRKGTSAEIAPNLDLQYSSTLLRYENWHKLQSDYFIRAGVEMKYADQVAQLRNADKAFSGTQRALFGGSKQEDTVFAKTLKSMLAITGNQSEVGEMYKTLNDFVGVKASNILSGTWKAATGLLGKDASLSIQDFERINRRLDNIGLSKPFQDINAMIVASPDVVQSRAANVLVQGMNSLCATFNLTLDAANTIMQIVSMPILTSPVLREAMQNMPEGAAKANIRGLVGVGLPGTKLVEPTPTKLIFSGIKAFFADSAKVDSYVAKGLLPVHAKEYLAGVESIALSGNHSTSQALEAMTKAANTAAKYGGNQKVEMLTRFIAAHAIEEIGKIRGLSESEILINQIGAIDKIHGISRYATRPQMFNGIIGQSIGLYQTYTWNLMQSVGRNLEKNDKVANAMIGGLQGTIFGLQSVPGFQTLNSAVANVNGAHRDIYNLAAAESDPNTVGAYMLYGMGSHLLPAAADLSTRGVVTPRNALIIPTTLQDLPAVGTMTKVIQNMVQTAEMLHDGNVSAGAALLHGLAHNSLSRPLQGVGNWLRGYTDTAAGQPLFIHANHKDYKELEDFNYGAIAARLLGTRPLQETMLMNTKFRRADTQAQMRSDVEAIGGQAKMAIASGQDVNPEMVRGFAQKFEESQLPIEHFNGFWARQLSATSKGNMDEFQRIMQKDDVTRRTYDRMMAERSFHAPWDELPVGSSQ